MSPHDDAFADAVVRSQEETARTLNPLALSLADRIKSLPEKCNREEIAAMIAPIEMYLCEISRLLLKPNQLYVFIVDQTCPYCKEAEQKALGK